MPSTGPRGSTGTEKLPVSHYRLPLPLMEVFSTWLDSKPDPLGQIYARSTDCKEKLKFSKHLLCTNTGDF